IDHRSDLKIVARHVLGSLDQVTVDYIEAFLVTSSGSLATAARRAASLRCFFGWGMKQGLCAHNPLAD
ncbi:MAG TPA: hypothetical protein VFO07_19785, partial [Roseiflexaceae bacterium]|nr:hypothetical protein [Roseiflexaceae bacterium]